jgi:hypothetical protein
LKFFNKQLSDYIIDSTFRNALNPQKKCVSYICPYIITIFSYRQPVHDASFPRDIVRGPAEVNLEGDGPDLARRHIDVFATSRGV